MDPEEQQLFDRDQLWNPYADSRLLYGDPSTEVEGVLWGIDIGTGEVMLADRLREKGKRSTPSSAITRRVRPTPISMM